MGAIDSGPVKATQTHTSRGPTPRHPLAGRGFFVPLPVSSWYDQEFHPTNPYRGTPRGLKVVTDLGNLRDMLARVVTCRSEARARLAVAMFGVFMLTSRRTVISRSMRPGPVRP